MYFGIAVHPWGKCLGTIYVVPDVPQGCVEISGDDAVAYREAAAFVRNLYRPRYRSAPQGRFKKHPGIQRHLARVIRKIEICALV